MMRQDGGCLDVLGCGIIVVLKCETRSEQFLLTPRFPSIYSAALFGWLRGLDLNQRPLCMSPWDTATGYNEL